MNLSKYFYKPLVICYLLTSCKASNQLNLNKLVVKNAIIAHRGMPRHAPEETAPSYWLAKKLGADYLEADLQRTKDGVLICLHDNNLRRTTDIDLVFPQRADLPANMFTLAELKQLDAGSWFNGANPDRARTSYEGLKILTLEELINIAEAENDSIGLYLETKNPELFPGIEHQLLELLDKRGWVNSNKKLVLQTFSTISLELLHEFFPNTPKCMLIWNDEEFLSGGVTPDNLKKALLFGKTYGATIVGPSFKGELNEYDNLLEKWMYDMYHEMGYIIHPYTFDTEKDQKQYIPLSDGQFTNRADLLLDYYKRAHVSIEEILIALEY